MTLASQLPKSWIICEKGDRWYRAVCRFLPSTQRESGRWGIDRVPYESAHRVASVAKAKQENTIVIWEVFADNAEEMARLDLIASLRADWFQSLQLAWLPSNCPMDARLAAQEAGVHFLLDELASMQKLIGILSGTVSPLG
jgi:hypothetical protein